MYGAANCVFEATRFRHAPYPHRTAVPIAQGRIESAFKTRGQTVQGAEGAPAQPHVAAARRPRTQPSPCAAVSTAGFPAASLFPVSARSQSRNARASGFSPDPGATARK